MQQRIKLKQGTEEISSKRKIKFYESVPAAPLKAVAAAPASMSFFFLQRNINNKPN
jgi:hypothetical protein